MVSLICLFNRQSGESKMPKKDNPPRRRIGFIRGNEEPDVEPMKQIDTTGENEEEQDESSTVLLNDYIPGAIYDGQGNIVTYESFRAKVRKLKAEAKSLRRISAGKFILYTSLAASIALLSYGAYKKYLSPVEKAKTEIQGRQR